MKNQTNSQAATVYDQAKEHFLGKFPSELPIEQAYLHIGIYIGWMIENHLYSEFFLDESEIQMFRFQNRQISCTVLSEIWDGHLGPDMFNKEGNDFSEDYYLIGDYVDDYIATLCKSYPTMYHVEDSWENYDLMKKKIDERFQEWKKNNG
ncbi:hypothetical protein [Xanthocytophaga agilis]|uniref:DUF7832 domain-containing protein n=1 Tax=Xanthocytophaga agilis TaxID=3048010 RepID=A0AAE3R6I0_9BACT|nr:hypothetical protein [Xanthocytophaga agilis]MDJ1504629.1 hypothetical protein [Xanthocytophaga agilis]